MSTNKKSIEDEIRSLIQEKYGSIQAFSDDSGINYQTLVSILKRGIQKASVKNVVKLCKTLKISTDELAKDRIVPADPGKPFFELREVLQAFKTAIQSGDKITIDGGLLDGGEAQRAYDAFELATEMIKRERAKK